MISKEEIKTVLVTGGAGYIGSVLVPKLLRKGFKVKVLDLYLYGDHVLNSVKSDPGLEEIKGDIRDTRLLKEILPGCDVVIHLACISNDPSFELNPALGKSINYDAFFGLVEVARSSQVRRFIYASSSSVYGVKNTPNVSEEMSLEPLTDYSKYKAMCEEVLLKARAPNFETLIIRPATVCGYSPRLRLDLTVNILTNIAINKGEITVFGGEQMRPNIHIEDMTDLYLECISLPTEKIDGKTFNAGYQNHRVKDIAQMVQENVGENVKVTTTPTDDNRSYHISSEKIKNELGFVPRFTLVDAIKDLKSAFERGLVPNSLSDSRYFNIKRMQEADLK